MKVVVVNGQNHKGSTWHAGHMLAQKLTSDEDITEFFLPRDFSDFCCGCVKCFTESEERCPHYEKLHPITEAVDAADVIILTSPVYVYHCTGSMKAWLDHYGWRWLVHRPEEKMFSKQAVVVSTAAGAGMKSANKDMKDSLSFWGVPRIYTLGTAVMEVSWDGVKDSIKEKLDRRTAKLAKKIISSGIKKRASFKSRILFFAMSKIHAGSENGADGSYWREKGWTSGKRPWKQEK
ncbi:MAG: NAD(P)H-dependent oxidoreductase [Ruminococcus sp.]|nr:NAD(P)H-dependent oxidoreductase [Ruminococcus sp.]